MMNGRDLVCRLACAMLAAAASAQAPAQSGAPFHVLHSNDSANVESCVSPFRER